jgi:hypothetical protein
MSDSEGRAGVLDWQTDWDAALAEARSTHRPVLIDVWKDP